jgi:hypothetical protein
MVRFLGAGRVEAYLRRLSYAVRRLDPRALVTYVNYPTTENLRLPFLDLVSFNVHLERQERRGNPTRTETETAGRDSGIPNSACGVREGSPPSAPFDPPRVITLIASCSPP